jgi:hypothetical protein
LASDCLIKLRGKRIDLRNPSQKAAIEAYQPSTVILAGNGALQNGWEPYRSHLKDIQDKLMPQIPGLGEYILNTPDPTIYLARQAYRYRFLEQVNSDSKDRENLEKIIHDIAKRYQKTPLKLQDFPEKAIRRIDKNILNDFAVVTTNWDRTLFTDRKFGKNIIQLHGICSRPETLILPTDFTIDSHINKRVTGSDDFSELYQMLNITHRWLKNAKTVITWGINFNPYDAELLAVAFVDYNRPKKEQENFKYLININPSKFARDQATYVFGVDPSKRWDIDPDRSELIHLNFIGR